MSKEGELEAIYIKSWDAVIESLKARDNSIDLLNEAGKVYNRAQKEVQKKWRIANKAHQKWQNALGIKASLEKTHK